MNCKIWEPLDSSPFRTSTVNTSVTHQFKNNHAKKKKNQRILSSFLAFISNNYNFEKLETVNVTPTYLITSTQKAWS